MKLTILSRARTAIAALLTVPVLALAIGPVNQAGAQPLPTAAAKRSSKVPPLSTLGTHPAPRSASGPPGGPWSDPVKTLTLSRPVFRFIEDDLGLAIGATRTMPVPAHGAIKLHVGGPVSLPLRLPQGVVAPRFTSTEITIGPRSGLLTAVATGPGASLTFSIAHASTSAASLQALAGNLRLDLPVFGTTVRLEGTLSDRTGTPSVDLHGSLGAPRALRSGPVTFEKGTNFRLTSGGGLVLSGPATLGSGVDAVAVVLSGPIAEARTWSLAAHPAPRSSSWPGAPGLTVAERFAGTVTDTAGQVRFDVTAAGGGARWHAAGHAVMAADKVEFADLSATAAVRALAWFSPGTPRVVVTGPVSVPAGHAGTLAGAGTVLIDAVTGEEFLSVAQSNRLTLTRSTTTVRLVNATLTGDYLNSAARRAGALSGFGQIAVAGTMGRRVSAHTTLKVDRTGTLTATFRLDPALVNLGPAGKIKTIQWSSAPKGGLSDVEAPGKPSAATPRGPARVTDGLLAPPTPSPALLGSSLQGQVTSTTTASTTTTTSPSTTTTAPAAATTTTTMRTTSTTVAGPSLTFDLSPAVDTLAADLGITLGASVTGSLSGSTLSLTVAPVTSLPVTLPAGLPSLTFGSTTLSIDESTGTLTLSATASASGGASGTLTIVVQKASTTQLAGHDLSTTLEIDNLPLLGSTVNLVGTLSYTGGALGASLTGTLAADLVLGPGLTLLQGATFTLDSGAGLTVSGSASLGTTTNSFQVGVAGAISGTKNWSLTVTASSSTAWVPVAGLSIQPNFTGSVSDTKGTIGFDVKATQVATWALAPAQGAGVSASIALTNVEVSNLAPPTTVTCPGYTAGDIWVDVQGNVTVQVAANSSTVTADGCVDVTAHSFSVSTQTSISLPGVTGVSFNNVILTVSYDGGTVSVTATAGISVAVINTTFNAGVMFQGNGTFVAMVAAVPPSDFGLTGTSAALFVATAATKHFDPSTLNLGITGVQPFDLKPGVTAIGSAAVPPTIGTELSDLKIPVKSVQGEATLSTTGFSISLAVEFGDTSNGIQFFNSDGAAVYLNSLSIATSAAASGVGFSASGEAYIVLPTLPGGTAPTGLDATMTGSLMQTDTGDLKLSFSFALAAIAGDCGPSGCYWANAFGIPGLEVSGLSATVGLDIEEDEPFPLPSLSFAVNNLVLPAQWSSDLGVLPGTQISLAVNFDLNNPLFAFSITNSSGPALEPLLPFSSVAAVQQALVLDDATFAFAPSGATDSSGTVWPPGYDLTVDANIGGVPINVDASLNFTQLSFNVNAQVGSLPLGNSGVSVPGPMLVMSASASATGGVQVAFHGGFSDSHTGISLSVSVYLNLSASLSSLANAQVNMTVTGGQPAWLAVGVNLSGTALVNGNGFSLTTTGNGYLDIDGYSIGSVAWSYNINSGFLWQDIANAATTVAQWFEDIPGWASQQYTSALQSLNYSVYQVAGALNYIGVSAAAIGQDIKNFFSVDYDGSMVYYLEQSGLTPTQIAGALKGAFNDTDTAVAAWLNDFGYNASQIGAALQNAYNDATYQVINVLGSLGISPQTIVNNISSFFTGNGSYNIATNDPWDFYIPLFMDVANGSQSPNGGVIQWPWDGGYNQDWYVVPIAGGWAELVNRNSGQCLSVYNGSTNAGTGLVQYNCNGGYNQWWYIGSGVYPGQSVNGWTTSMENGGSGLFADVYGASGSEGAGLDQWYWNGAWNQSWHFSQAIG